MPCANTSCRAGRDDPSLRFGDDELARMVAHEIRNAMTPIRAAAQTALEPPVDAASLARVAHQAIAAADRIAAVTDALLDRDPASMDVISAAGAVDEIIQSHPTFAPVQIGEADGSEDSVEIQTDAAVVHHILSNLIANAVRASGGDASKVVVQALRSTWNIEDEARDGAEFVIRDVGPGLPQAQLALINSGPVRGVDQLAASSGGVGLVVVRRLLKAIGGQVVASNLPQGGAEFRVFIPDVHARAAAFAA